MGATGATGAKLLQAGRVVMGTVAMAAKTAANVREVMEVVMAAVMKEAEVTWVVVVSEMAAVPLVVAVVETEAAVAPVACQQAPLAGSLAVGAAKATEVVKAKRVVVRWVVAKASGGR